MQEPRPHGPPGRNRSASDEVSPRTLAREAAVFRNLFDDCYAQWEVCGAVRLNRCGTEVLHVVNPNTVTDASGRARGGTLFAHRLAHRLGHRLGHLYQSGQVSQPPGCGGLEIVKFRGRKHTIVLTPADCWGVALALHTGPPGYWRLLKSRLEAAGTLAVEGLAVVWLGRPGSAIGRGVVPCPDERTFFRLARTEYVPPPFRFDRAGSRDHKTGMLRPWYPAPFGPGGQPGLIPPAGARPPQPTDPRKES